MRLGRFGWAPHVFSMELRKLVAYRMDFWIGFLGSLLSSIGIAYFLWSAIFEHQQAQKIGGYSFHGMMLYYLVVSLVAKMVQPQDMGIISQDIYQGSLNRYLVYPVPFFPYKFIENLAHVLVFSLQLLLATAFFIAFFGLPEGQGLGAWSVLGGLVAAFLASYLYFSLASLLEMLAFWADNIWSLLVMLRIATSLLGGVVLPLSVFPEGLRQALEWLPFGYLFSFPARVFLGELGVLEWLHGLGFLLGWSVLASLAAWVLWKKGTRQYSGVGI